MRRCFWPPPPPLQQAPLQRRLIGNSRFQQPPELDWMLSEYRIAVSAVFQPSCKPSGMPKQTCMQAAALIIRHHTALACSQARPSRGLAPVERALLSFIEQNAYLQAAAIHRQTTLACSQVRSSRGSALTAHSNSSAERCRAGGRRAVSAGGRSGSHKIRPCAIQQGAAQGLAQQWQGEVGCQSVCRCTSPACRAKPL